MCLPKLVCMVLSLLSYILFSCMLVSTIGDHVMDQPVSHWPSATEACVKSHATPYEVYGGQSGTGMVSSLRTWVLPSQYPYSFLHLPLTVLNLSS